MRLTLMTLLMCLSTVLMAQSLKSLSVQKSGNISQKPAVLPYSNSEVKFRNCYTTQMEARLLEKFPHRSKSSFEDVLQQAIARKQNARNSNTDQIYRIPTIVHVVHNGESVGTEANISEEQVSSQFDVLNEDFRRMGAGFNGHPDGADIFVEFYPVTLDPEGNSLSEPGISRVDGGRAFWEGQPIEEVLKPETIWNPEKFFNIWVVNFGGDMDGVLGYAQFPSLSDLDGLNEDEGPTDTDGIVIGYPFFGNTGNVQEPFDQGRTTTHEVGHWLGLRHIWGDGGCEADDYCTDTPNAGGPNSGCSDNDSCTGDNLPDMIENYMDYTDDACMNIFTQEQKARMRTVLEISPRRNTLIGPVCDDATMVEAGANNSTAPAWHTYTATADGVLTVSSVGQTEQNTLLSLSGACGLPPINSSDDALGTAQSELSVLVEAGDEMKIFWSARYSEEAFDWTLALEEATDAQVCDLAEDAVEGTNSLPATSLKSYWYKFTMSQTDSKLVIDGGDQYKRIYNGSCDSLVLLKEGTGTHQMLDLEVGTEIYVAFEPAGGNFNWTLQVETLEVGEACRTAAEATEGTNTVGTTPYWYTFTMPENGILTVSSADSEVNTYGEIYGNCPGSLIAGNEPLGDQAEIQIPLNGGEEVYIFWDSIYSAEGFEWIIEVAPFAPGETCASADTAILGTNTTTGAPYWYTYTMTEDAGLVVSSVGQTDHDTYAFIFDECNGELLAESDDHTGVQSQAVVASLEAGQTVKILWGDDYSFDPFDWTLSTFEPLPGESCEIPNEAAIGTNTVEPDDVKGEFYWNAFTIPESGKKITASSSSGAYVFMVDGCEGSLIAEGYENVTAFDLEAGEDIYIAWLLEEVNTFEWELTVDEIAPGDLCDMPETAVEGTNTVPDGILSGYFWSIYEVPENEKKLVVSTSAEAYGYLVKDCDLEVVTAGQGGFNFAGLEQGQEVLIVWEVMGDGFEWELALEDLADGDLCDRPLAALVGTNNSPYAPYWYTFTMPKEGDIEITSIGATEEDTYLIVYEDCEGFPVIENDDFGDSYQSQVVLEDVPAGETILISWKEYYSNAAFSWRLSLGVDNIAPVLQRHSFQIPTETLQDGDVIGTIEASDADGDELIFKIKSGNESGIFALHETSGALTLEDKSLWDLEDVELAVEATDGITIAAATVEISSLVLQSPDENEGLGIYPNPTQGILHIAIPHGAYYQGGTLTDLSGKRVRTFSANQKELNLMDIGEGVYLLNLHLDDQYFTKKIIIRR